MIANHNGQSTGPVALSSAGPIAFGPDGILFLADNAGATVFAVELADPGAAAEVAPLDLDEVDAQVTADSAAIRLTS